MAAELDARGLITRCRPRYWIKLNTPQIDRLLRALAGWPTPVSAARRSPASREAERLVRFLAHQLETLQKKLLRMERLHGDYSKHYGRAATQSERQRLVLEYAEALGASRRGLAGDRQAFKRWFGHAAVCDRYQRRLQEAERDLCFLLDCLARQAAFLLERDGQEEGWAALWQRLGLEPTLVSLFQHTGDARVPAAAFHALSTALQAMPREHQENSIGGDAVLFIYKCALDPHRDVWLQCEAVDLLRSLAPAAFAEVLRKRLAMPRAGDDLFVRRRGVEVLGEQLQNYPEQGGLLELAVADPSPYVRQAAAKALRWASPSALATLLPRLLLNDDCPAVRGAAALALLDLIDGGAGGDTALPLLAQCLGRDADAFALRVAITVARRGAEALEPHAPDAAQAWREGLAAPLAALHGTAPSLAVRRWAGQALESLQVLGDPRLRALRDGLAAFVLDIPVGGSRRLQARWASYGDDDLGRALSLLAEDDFGFDIERTWAGTFVSRGPLFGFRLWRFIHELRHPSPDKRQAFPHTIGRRYYGELRAPSAVLAELAQTKVPGEPLFVGEESGWRPYLPLADDVLSSLAWTARPTRVFSSEGVTEIIPPRHWPQRAWARWRLSWRFAEFAELRNWAEDSRRQASAYVDALAGLGIRIRFLGHNPACEDPAVARFFPAALAVPLGGWWEAFQQYFVSVYENSLRDLSIYLAAVLAYFFGRHILAFRAMRRARGRLPFVAGGWGTRGKSGTERIKAALFNALGYGIVSKTTGCEAMFLHAYPFGPLREMFLFRPYDKATIWEQHNLVRFSAEIGCEVFLWECMALTPSYVYLLQRQWMRDDLSTLTNAYPDHEDIQGPAGFNIPQVMACFIPERATLLTSEEQMLPLFRDQARRVRTELRAVGWLEAGLLAPDVLARFPYDEHPYNIALVLAMARELEVPEDYALKEMADRVVPDLGVLKTFPAAPYLGRRLEFMNGMSANERFGCLGNWRRMGLDAVQPEREPGVWITVVVNNRADRIARSRVFADILVRDIAFDRVVLIGNNLAGLQGYIQESWQAWIETIRLPAGAAARALLQEVARRFRIPYADDRVAARLRAMLDELSPAPDGEALARLLDAGPDPAALAGRLRELGSAHAEEVAAWLKQDLALLAGYQTFSQRLERAEAGLEKAFHELLWSWFEAKIVVVADYHATGNQVVERIGAVCPPGFHNRIMGVQNIKGTGLDFVYRWQAWEACHDACQQLLSVKPAVFNEGLRRLAAFTDYGPLCEDAVRAAVARAKASPLSQQERHQAALTLVESNLDSALASLRAARSEGSERPSWTARAIDAIEPFFDVGDAVKRRKMADRIYRDLIAERISHERAALELQALNKRQKGHWLVGELTRQPQKI